MCALCEHAKEHGWWGESGITHCRRCHRSWKSLTQGHCAACCRHFSSASAFEKHFRKDGECMSDRSLKRKGMIRHDDKYGTIWKLRADTRWDDSDA